MIGEAAEKSSLHDGAIGVGFEHEGGASITAVDRTGEKPR